MINLLCVCVCVIVCVIVCVCVCVCGLNLLPDSRVPVVVSNNFFF